MAAMKIIDLSKSERPYDFEESDFIIITGITELNLNDAIKIAESARESGAVTVGVPHRKYGEKIAFVKMSLPPSEKGFDEVRIIDDILKEFCGDDVSPCFSNKFISKGHHPKELETDGIFPGYILADCLMNDIKARNTGMTDILLESGISLGKHCVKSLVPSLRNPKILQAFINYGWNVNSRDEKGYTLMRYAAAECSYECVKLLAEAGADVNARDKKGYTPLMIMMINCSNDTDTAHEILKYLLAKGADINARNIHGQNAAMLAVTSDYNAKDSNVIRVLAEFGADIHDGLMTLAVDCANVNAVKILLSLGAKLPGKNAVKVTKND